MTFPQLIVRQGVGGARLIDPGVYVTVCYLHAKNHLFCHLLEISVFYHLKVLSNTLTFYQF